MKGFDETSEGIFEFILIIIEYYYYFVSAKKAPCHTTKNPQTISAKSIQS